MMSSPFLRALCCCLLLCLGHIAHAARLTSFCITSYDATPVTPLPTATTSATTTTTRTVKVTSTPRTTALASTITKTKIATSTIKSTVTLPRTTNTYTSFVTHTSIAVATVTSVTTETSTNTITTTNTDPVTASTSAGFTPLASIVASAGWSPSPSTCGQPVRRGLSRLNMRDVKKKRQGPPPSHPPPTGPPTTSSVTIVATSGTVSASPSQFPTRVDCTTLYYATTISTSTIAASTTVTVNPRASTATVTTTTTTTVISTKYPSGVVLTTSDVTTTMTAYVTQASTTTETSTTTTTTYQPASTYYPTCDDNNLVGCVDGNNQVAQILVKYNFYQISGPTNPRECCIACSLDRGCGGSAYYPFQSACYGLIDNSQCNANATYGTFGVAPNGSPITLSNGNCGQWVFKGSPS